MNIKYKFNSDEKVSTPLTSTDIFKEPGIEYNGGLFPMTGGSPSEVFSNNINLINQRINEITKQLSYWDLYKLVSQVTTPTELDSIFAGLIPGQACVINCNSFLNNNQSYHRGDVIVKMLNGEAAYIPAVATGLYYPKNLYQNAVKNNKSYYYYYWFNKNNITIKIDEQDYIEPSWCICSKVNVEDVLEIIEGTNYRIKEGELLEFYEDLQSAEDAGYTINPNLNLDYQYTKEEPKANDIQQFKIPTQSNITKSVIYGYYEELNEESFDFPVAFIPDPTDQENNIEIKPIIKIFSGLNEETDVKIRVNKILINGENYWSVTFPEGLPAGGDFEHMYIQVK